MNEYGIIESMFIKKVEHAFIDNQHIQKYWKKLNYIDCPSFTKAIQEFEIFEDILNQFCKNLLYFPENPEVNMDSIYCRDASIATSYGMILANMGKRARQQEPLAQKKIFEANCIPVLGEITAPGTLEGGDVVWINNRTLAVGHSYRTNEEGIRQLQQLLFPIDVDIIVVPLPHFNGPEDVFHLMSIFSPVDKDLAIVFSPYMPIVFRNALLDRGFQLIEVPPEEFISMGCNVLALSARVCLILEGNPQTQRLMEEAGCQVITYPGTEISLKGGGGPTCLTRPVLRSY